MSKLDELIALAHEPSSERRRELLREVTDMFFTGPADHNPREMELFDGVLSTLANEMEEEVRAELSGRMAEAAQPPKTLIRRLAADTIAVAEPVLANSQALSEADLLEVVSTRGQEHLRAVSCRAGLSEKVSDVIVDRGDDTTLGTLLRNQDAPLSRRAAETVVDRAAQNPELHEAVVERQSLPIDLLNDMYFMVEAQLRDRILARNADVDPAALEEALSSGRKRMASRDGVLPADYAEAEAHIRSLKARGGISPSTLAAFLRNGERSRFIMALAELADVDFTVCQRIIERKDLDALALICKAADFERALFLTFTILILENGQGMGQAEDYGRRYVELPRDVALRTLRFWRMRRATGQIAAA
ncbi:MAG: DUF2336 domain-containing protein [Caulobacteraceae bacterium]